MAINFDKFNFVSIDTIRKYDKATGKLEWILDELQDATLSSGEEMVFGTGKLGNRITSLKKNKTAMLTANNGFVVGGLLADQWGSAPKTSTTNTLTGNVMEFLTVTATNTVVTTYTATGTAGNEIGWIYDPTSDRVQGTAYAQGAVVSASIFTYTTGTKTIALPTGVFNQGDEVLVSYNYLTGGKEWTNSASNVSGDGIVIVDLTVKDSCNNNEYHAIVTSNNASLSGALELVFGGDQTVHGLTVEFLPNQCDAAKDFFTFLIPELAV